MLQTIPTGLLAANCYLIGKEGREDCVLIDAGDDPQKLLRAVKDSGRRLSDIVLTHGHFDHMLGAPSLREETGARIHIHERDAECLSSSRCNLAEEMPTGTPFVPFEADDLLHGASCTLEAAGFCFQVMNTPGHTPGGICLLDSEDGWLFTGDTLFYGGYGRYDFPGGSFKDLWKSLGFLEQLDPDLIVYSGHGPAGELRRAIGGLV